MAFSMEDTETRQASLAYVIALYDELTEENGAPTLGTQNQAVDFILADPELSRAIAEWAAESRTTEATAVPPRRVPQDVLYARVRAHLAQIMEPPAFAESQRR
jgi:hypothetical protein